MEHPGPGLRNWIPALLASLLVLAASLAQDTPDGTGAPPPSSDKAKQEPPEKRPPPSVEEQKRAEKEIRQLFREEYAKRKPDDLRDLAQKLLGFARDTKGSAATDQYALLKEARDIAAKAGEAKLAMAAVDEMAARFTVDAAKMKADTLDEVKRNARSPGAARALAEAYLSVADEAAKEEDFDAAVSLAKKAEAAAQSAQEPAFAARIRDRGQELRALQEEHRRLRSSLARLAEQPDDPAANLAVGRYRCLSREEWDKGLPFLARGSDPRLREPAQRELASPPATADEYRLLGNGWWDAAQKESSRAEKGSLLGRALHWYEKAIPALKGIARIQVQERIENCYEHARFGIRQVFVAEKSMKPYPIGYRQMSFPPMETDDPTGPFQGKPFYFNQRTGTDVVYEIRSDTKLRRVTWKGAAMQEMKIEILDPAGTLVAEGGPYGGGNKWAEFTLDFPPSNRFTLRLRNFISTWYFIDTLRLQ